MDIIAHAAGFSAFLVVTASLVSKDDIALRRFNVAGCLLWAIHFALIGAWFACLMLCLAVAMIGAGLVGRDRLSNAAWAANIALIPVVIALAVLERAAWASLSPVIGGLLINTGVTRCRGHAMSAMIGAGEMFWILTGLLVASPSVILANLFSLTALAIRTARISRTAPKVAGMRAPAAT